MERIAYLNILRLLATLGVVVLHCSSTWLDNGIYVDEDHLAFSFYDLINVFTVPMFVLISGALFLNPAKDTGYRIIISKYVRRISLALLIFGLPMCIAEMFFSGGSWGSAVFNFLTGNSWGHMWYLYMLVGLYLMTPILKAFVCCSTRKSLFVALVVLFIMSSVLPTLKYYGIPINGWLTFNNPYIFLYLAGYYLVTMKVNRVKLWMIIAVLAICVFIICSKAIAGTDTKMYFAPESLIMAMSLFLLFKKKDFKWHIADLIAPYCFGIYITHTLFYNFLQKVVHVSPADYMNAWISIPILGMLVFLLSLGICYILRKNYWLKKYVL